MDIDIAQLAAQTAAFLSPFLPYLIKGGKIAAKKAFEKAGEIFAEESWEQAEKLWGKFQPKMDEKPLAQAAVQELAKKPDDEDAQETLHKQFKKIFNEDTEFAKEVSITIGEINNTSVQADHGSLVVSGDITNAPIIVGHGNTQNNTNIEKQTNIDSLQVVIQNADKQNAQAQAGLTAKYLNYLVEQCQKLPLGTIYRKFEKTAQSDSVKVQNIYTDLDIQPRFHQERMQHKEEQVLEREQEQRLSVLRALDDERLKRIVLLGDPGSGKTTCVHYLTVALAMLQQKPELAETLLPEGSMLARYFPVRLVLRDVAAQHLPATLPEVTAEVFWNALQADIAKPLGDTTAKQLMEHLRDQIRNQPCLIMLDGLDEVPEGEERRARLLKAIELFSSSLHKESIVVVTARPYAYDNPKWQLPNFDTITLLPFSEEQIAQFIEQFFQAIREEKGWDEEIASQRGATLLADIQRNNLLGLAERPLLLTLIASLNASDGKLPDDRADLYEETIGLLLQRWQLRFGTGNNLDVENADVLNALYLLAYNVHKRQGSEPTRKEDAPADIREDEILIAFKALLGKEDFDTLLRYLDTRAGILLGRGEGMYTFPHRSFQEYLAACYLTDRSPKELKQLLTQDVKWWREVALLAIAKTNRGGLWNAATLIDFLVPGEPTEPIQPVDWQIAGLAGQAMVEMKLVEKRDEDASYHIKIRRITSWLIALLAGGHLTPRERAEAGDTLARLGDPRPGVTIDFLFCEIPAGKFQMGSKQGDKDSRDNEYPQFEYDIKQKYFMSRYPITNMQFNLFVEDPDGYANEKWYTDAGKKWREEAKQDKPRRQGGAFDLSNHPVVNVSWYEAVAFTHWLTDKLQNENAKLKLWDQDNIKEISIDFSKWETRLPTEAEWEKAARGDKGLPYPWGTDFDQDRVNNNMIIGSTSAVGSFPAGKSPYGLLDMSGNVWEWCATQWTGDYKNYALRENEKNDLEGNVIRVLRGGAFIDYERNVRCAIRLYHYPDLRFNYFGFRVVLVASPISLSRSGS